MNNRNSLAALLAGLLVGGAAFYLLYQKASEMNKKTTPVGILVASHYIPGGSFLKKEMVDKKQIPEAYVSPSAIRDIQEVEGLLTLVPISAGEQIQSNKFGMGEETLSLSLSPGFRAYTLAVNETSGVGNLIRPGNRVDIVGKITSGGRSLTSFVYQNLQVLAVGQKLNFLRRAGGNSPVNEGGENNDAGYTTVTLAVTPEQAETLMYLEGNSLRLLLRAPGDEEILSIPPQSEGEILSRLGRVYQKPKSQSIQIIDNH
jgi:pilus assembly protein CpaB